MQLAIRYLHVIQGQETVTDESAVIWVYIIYNHIIVIFILVIDFLVMCFGCICCSKSQVAPSLLCSVETCGILEDIRLASKRSGIAACFNAVELSRLLTLNGVVQEDYDLNDWVANSDRDRSFQAQHWWRTLSKESLKIHVSLVGISLTLRVLNNWSIWSLGSHILQDQHEQRGELRLSCDLTAPVGMHIS